MNKSKIKVIIKVISSLGFLMSVFYSFMTIILLDSVTPENGGMTTAERVQALFQGYFSPYVALLFLFVFVSVTVNKGSLLRK